MESGLLISGFLILEVSVPQVCAVMREEFQGKDLEVQAGAITRVVGGRAGALGALTN